VFRYTQNKTVLGTGKSDSMPERTVGTEPFIPNACSKELGKDSRIYGNTGEGFYYTE
jgi:hypothetical protein